MMYAKHLQDAGTSDLGIFARNDWKCPIKTRTRMCIIRGADLKEDRRSATNLILIWWTYTKYKPNKAIISCR